MMLLKQVDALHKCNRAVLICSAAAACESSWRRHLCPSVLCVALRILLFFFAVVFLSSRHFLLSFDPYVGGGVGLGNIKAKERSLVLQ